MAFLMCNFIQTKLSISTCLIVGALALFAQRGFAEEWKLVWFDEFDYTGLPDSSKWDYEEGFVRNNESQYYTRARPENARVENGILIIEARKEQFKNPKYKPDSNNWVEQHEYAAYTAASLVTRGKASWIRGRIEVRAKLPQGKGVWPAIWTLGVTCPGVKWPDCGEIDIMEFLGRQPDRVYGTLHYAVDGKHCQVQGAFEAKNLQDTFHLYAIEWFDDRIDFFVDSIKYRTIAIDGAGKGGENPFRKPHYLLMNLALGGSWGGPIDDSVLPQKYLIDYVRVYESAGGK